MTEAEKPLRNGRIQLEVTKQRGAGALYTKYVLDIHFDPTKHSGILSIHTPASKSPTDCKELRDFVQKYVFSLLRKHRPRAYRNAKSKYSL